MGEPVLLIQETGLPPTGATSFGRASNQNSECSGRKQAGAEAEED
jgi:hypothetical protein